MSLYWALGGHALVSTIGGYAEQFARRGGTLPVLVALAATLAKVAGGLLALALVRPWGRVVPRGWLLIGSAGASVLLVVDGGLNVVLGALVLSGVIHPAGSVDGRTAGQGGGGTESLMAADGEPAHAEAPPTLVGRRVRLRPGRPGDAPRLREILAEPSVSRWWGEPDPVAVIEEDLRGGGSSVLLVVEVDGQVAGGISYHEENDPMYRHAGIDIYLGRRFQGQGAGREAVALLARYLFGQRGHHRITIDPAAANDQAIRSYSKVGFRPVGVMRQYERGGDGHFHDGLLMDLLRGELAENW